MARILEDTEAATYLLNAGFMGYRIPTMFAIGMAESRLDAHVDHLNDHDPTSRSYLSLDLGWLQINTYWWIDHNPFVRVQDMFDPQKCANMDWALFVASGGSQWNPAPGYKAWNTYRNNLHLPFLRRGADAWRAIGAPQ